MNDALPPIKDDATVVAASVIIPAYQAEDFVADAIRSALAQTRSDIEVIVVDDGSTDGTWDIVLACAREDTRVVPMQSKRRGGPSAARNAAMGAARGRWLAVLDADDLYLPDRLERMIVAAESLGADLLADNLLKVDFATGEVSGQRFSPDAMALPCPVRLIDAMQRDIPGRRATGEMFGYFQPIIRRDFLERHDIRYAEDIQIGEDFLLYAECIARGGRFHLAPGAWYVQRLRPGSHSAQREAMLHLSAANRRIARLTPWCDDAALSSLLQRRQEQIDIDCFSLLLELGRLREAVRHAHCGSPARLLRHLRAVCGAVRFHLTARRASGKGAATPVHELPATAREPAPPRSGHGHAKRLGEGALLEPRFASPAGHSVASTTLPGADRNPPRRGA